MDWITKSEAGVIAVLGEKLYTALESSCTNYKVRILKINIDLLITYCGNLKLISFTTKTQIISLNKRK